MAANRDGSTQRKATTGSGFTLLDGIALVIGAAIASVHLRQAAPTEAMSGAGWVMMWLTFSGIALTASGPFLSLIRWISGRPGTPARLGDRLWLLLGTPWVVAALPRIVAGPGREGEDLIGQLSEFALVTGLGVATLVTLAVVWSRWVMVPPDAPGEGGAGSWTHRVGLSLAVAWPLQCGLGMVVMGSQA